jgi:signal peptidase I
MAVGGLLRGLVSPAGGAAAWLPCHELFASWQHWLPSLSRLRPPASDGFKLLFVLLLFSAALAEVRYIASSSMAPTLRPGDRAVAEKVNPPTPLSPLPSLSLISFALLRSLLLVLVTLHYFYC